MPVEAQEQYLTVHLSLQFGGRTKGQQPGLPGGQQWDLCARGCSKFTFSEVGSPGEAGRLGGRWSDIPAGLGLSWACFTDLELPAQT